MKGNNHILINRWSHIYLGALNLTDLIISKMFRKAPADREDCIAAFATGQVKAEKLLERYSEAARYDLNPEKVWQNFGYLVEGLYEEQLINDKFYQKISDHQQSWGYEEGPTKGPEPCSAGDR